MFSHETTALLHKSLPSLPFTLISRSLKHDIDELVALQFPTGKLAIVDDANTAQAFGDQVFRALKSRFECVHITISGGADDGTVAHVRQKSSVCDALVAVGSGTVNDVCKYASFLDNKPYVAFPTAASMNGYLSANASITIEGYKKTLPAHMPQAVLCDMSIIANAPARLNKSGLGDSLARSTAQADWLLSHLWLGTPYNDSAFELLKPLEPQLHEAARGIAKGDAANIEVLMQALLLSGLGMTICRGSYPASQSEHMIAHAHEMLVASSKLHGASTLHGEEIGVTTLTMARLQERLLHAKPRLQPTDFPYEAMQKLFGAKTTEEAKKAYGLKQELMLAASAALHWDEVAGRIEAITIPSEKIHAILKAAECPDTPEALKWKTEEFEIAKTYARFLRDRFTFLDIPALVAGSGK